MVEGFIPVPETPSVQAIYIKGSNERWPLPLPPPPPQTHIRRSGCQSKSSDPIAARKGEFGPDISEARNGRQEALEARPRGDPGVLNAWLTVGDH